VTQKSTRSKKLHCEDCIRGRFNKRIEKSIVNIQSEKLLDEFIGQINEAIDSDRDIAIAAEMPNTNMTIDQILKERDKEGDTE
jgi:hypothetical protein